MWKIGMLEGKDIVNVVTSGTMNRGHIIQMCADAIAFGREHRTDRYLVDHSRAALDSSVSTLDICRLPMLLKKLKGENGNKVAVVISPEVKGEDDFPLFKTLFHSRRQPMKLFTGEDQALKWLAQH